MISAILMTITFYVKNLVGVRFSEDQMKQISSPTLEVMGHVTLRAVQAFSIIGGLLCSPGYQFYNGARTLQAIFQFCVPAATRGAAIGAVMGPLMCLARLGNQSEERIYDRAYRLRHNRNQHRVDKCWFVGSAVGPVVANYAFAASCANPVVSGLIIGGAAGVFVAATCNGFAGENPQKTE